MGELKLEKLVGGPERISALFVYERGRSHAPRALLEAPSLVGLLVLWKIMDCKTAIGPGAFTFFSGRT